MFSKLATSLAPTEPTGSVQPLSIAARLTLWQALCGFLLLVAATALLYWTLASGLVRDDDEFLLGRMDVLVPMLAGSADSPSEIAEEIDRESGSRSPSRLYIRLLNGEGVVIGETPGMADVLPRQLFPKPLGLGSVGIEPFDLSSASDRPFRAAITAVPPANASGMHIIQMAVDRTGEQMLLKTYRGRMATILLIGLLLFALTAWLITRRGMRPIAALTHIVQQVQINRMQPQVGPAQWPGELTQLAQSFDAMLNRLEQGFQALERFSADIAHELRTPLIILRGEAEVALRHARSPEEYRDVLESSLEEYQRLSRLVDSLLFLARARHGADQIEKKKLDARSEIVALSEFYEDVAAERGIAVHVIGHAECFADPILFRRALGNLLSNALRYTPPCGAVRASIEPGDHYGVIIKVVDNGSGIGQEHLPHIFDRFYRADAGRARDGEGAGLGLAIVKSIMTLHGGSVEIDSALGHGTTVTLSFP